MELYPSDLGKNRYLALLRRRAWVGMQQGNSSMKNGMGWAATSTVTLTAEDIKPSKHPFSKFWTKDLRVRDEETRAKAAMVAQGGSGGIGWTLATIFSGVYLVAVPSIIGVASGHPEVAGALTVAWSGGVYALWRFGPRHWLQKIERQPLAATEIESFLPAARGTLERQYLALALDIQRASVPTETARNEIRTSLMALGEAVAALPAEPPTHGVTAVAYKNALLQIGHLRDVVASFDNGIAAAVGTSATNEAGASIDRLHREAKSLARAHQELEEELGSVLLAELAASGGAAPTSAPATTVTTAPQSEQPAAQVIGVGNGIAGAGTPGTGTSGNGGKWWQKSG